MAIKSIPFGRTELSGKDAARFIQHMNEDKPNKKLESALKKAKKIIIHPPRILPVNLTVELKLD